MPSSGGLVVFPVDEQLVQHGVQREHDPYKVGATAHERRETEQEFYQVRAHNRPGAELNEMVRMVPTSPHRAPSRWRFKRQWSL